MQRNIDQINKEINLHDKKVMYERQLIYEKAENLRCKNVPSDEALSEYEEFFDALSDANGSISDIESILFQKYFF